MVPKCQLGIITETFDGFIWILDFHQLSFSFASHQNCFFAAKSFFFLKTRCQALEFKLLVYSQFHYYYY